MINFHSDTTVKGDMIGRDKIVHGNVIRGDKVMGNQIAQDTVAILLVRLKDELYDLDLSSNQKLLGQKFVTHLTNELTQDTKLPNLNSIQVAKEWFLQNMPSLTETINTLFAHPDIIRKIDMAATI